jgi:hypothetical protein
MELIRYYQASRPGAFPFAAAIGAAVFGTEAVVLDCFLLVDNRGPFLGLKRRTLPPHTSLDTALEEMMTQLDRIHQNMVRAAQRRSRLTADAKADAWSSLVDMPPGFLQALWNRQIFIPHLRWIGQNTISGILGCHIADLAKAENAPADDNPIGGQQ